MSTSPKRHVKKTTKASRSASPVKPSSTSEAAPKPAKVDKTVVYDLIHNWRAVFRGMSLSIPTSLANTLDSWREQTERVFTVLKMVLYEHMAQALDSGSTTQAQEIAARIKVVGSVLNKPE